MNGYLGNINIKRKKNVVREEKNRWILNTSFDINIIKKNRFIYNNIIF